MPGINNVENIIERILVEASRNTYRHLCPLPQCVIMTFSTQLLVYSIIIYTII